MTVEFRKSNMDEKNYVYDAFISYRHAPLDIYVAERLHKMLERFRLPMMADRSAIEKKKIDRVFRDRDELPVSDDLSESISEALINSRYLIVICSPRTPESSWVEKEIIEFEKMHGRDKILAVLIEGEPQESFPYALCHEKDPLTGEYIEVEPLAADIRAASKRQSIKILKKELLRLVAPIFSCKYDDLKQRHKEYKLKRTALIASLICLFLLVIGTYSTIQSVRISNQAKEINRLFASEEASKAISLYENGKREDAIAAVTDAYNRMETDEEIPAVHNAMAKVLRVYDTGMSREPWSQYKMQGIITSADISTNQNYMAAVDEVGNISVWDIYTGENVFQYKMRCDSTSMGVFTDGLRFVDEDTFVYLGANERGCINAKSREVHSEESDFFGRVCCFSDNMKYCLVSDGEDLQVFSTDTMESIFSLEGVEQLPVEEGENTGSGITGGLAVSDNGKYLSYGRMGWDDESAVLYVVDIEEKKEVIRSELDYNYPKHAHISNDGSGMIVSKETNTKGSFLSDSDEMILFYDSNGEVVNKQEYYGTVSDKPVVSDGKYIVMADSSLMIFDLASGEKLADMDMSSDIEALYLSDNKSTLCYAFLKDGTIEYVSDLGDGKYSLSELVENSKTSVLLRKPSSDGLGYLSVPANSNEAYLYVRKTSDALEEICQINSYMTGAILNSENNKVAMHSLTEGSITVCGISNSDYNKLSIATKTFENNIIVDAGNGKNYVTLGFADINVYDWDKDEAVATLESDYIISPYFCPSNQCVYVSDDFEIKVYSLPDLKEENTIPLEMVENYIVFNEGNTIAYTDYYGECHIYQIDSKEDVVIPASAGTLVPSSDDKSFAVNDTSSNMFRAYDSEGKEIASCENSALLVKSFGYSNDRAYFFVTYSNGEFEIRNSNDFSLVASVSGINTTITELKKIDTLNKYVLLSKEWYGEEGYILSSNYELETQIRNLFAVTSDGRIICGNANTLYIAPYYSSKELDDYIK